MQKMNNKEIINKIQNLKDKKYDAEIQEKVLKSKLDEIEKELLSLGIDKDNIDETLQELKKNIDKIENNIIKGLNSIESKLNEKQD
jgi:hypothetical protein